MGNILRVLYERCVEPITSEESGSLGPHGVSAATIGVSALAHDLFNFEITSQVIVIAFLMAIFLCLFAFS